MPDPAHDPAAAAGQGQAAYYDPLTPFLDGTFDTVRAEQAAGPGGAFPDPYGNGALMNAYPGIHIPTGDELYNMLMGEIEPELTTAELPLLDARYKTETPEQSKARAKRYEQAFAEYDKRLRAYMDDLQNKLRAHQRIAMSSAELGAKSEEQDALTAIESSIATSS